VETKKAVKPTDEKRILIVDDDDLFAELLSDTLTSQGYEVLTAGDGMEALDKVRQHLPSYIFLDLILPKIDGIRVCRYLKEDPRYASIPVIVLTGIAAEEPSRLKEIGADAYIAKGKVEEVMAHVLSTLKALEENRETRPGHILGLEKIYPRKLVRALLFTRSHQELLLRNMTEGVVEADAEGKILYLNPAALRILEREEFDLIGSPIASLWEASHQEALSSLLSRLTLSSPRQETFTLTYGEKTLNLHFANLLENGAYAGLLLLLQDVSSLTKKIEELSTLNEVGKVLNSTLELQTILNLVMERVKEMMKVEAGSLLLLDETTQELVFEVALGPAAAQLKGMRLPPQQGLAGWVFQHAESALIPDVASDPRFSRKVDESTGFTTKSMICVPLKVKEKTMGVIQVINRVNDQAFTEADVSLLEAIGTQAALAIEKGRLFEKVKAQGRELQELSIRDDLTRLYNKRYFNQKLKAEFVRARRQKRPLCILLFDLDNFKVYNDAEGHLEGDKVLRQTSEIVLRNIRDHVDSGFRYGGDEFTIILPESREEEALAVAERIRSHVEKANQGRVTLSIGVVEYKDDYDIVSMIRYADRAMYTAKNKGGNRIHVHQD
jgi:diguanylate cyclase (GGDEF)-like protein/PAS domain S-box-containing protein